jgi:hypothetical protein
LQLNALQAIASHCGYSYLVLQASAFRIGYCKILHCKLLHRKLLVLQATTTVAGIEAIASYCKPLGLWQPVALQPIATHCGY